MSLEKGRMKVVSQLQTSSSKRREFDKLILFCSDGIGLACGILEHLLNLRDAPRVIAATHFHEIFENGFLRPRPRLQLGHMEVQVCETAEQIENQITYLYKYDTD